MWFVPEYLYDVDAAGMVKSLTKQKEDMEALGQQYEAEGGASYRALCYRLDAMERAVAAQQEMLSTDLQIAVTHVPLIQDYIRTSLEWADEEKVFSFRTINLLLAGHYCGGQWRVPGMGALYVPDIGWLPPDDGLMGMQRVNSINQYISGGLGASEAHPLKGRLFNSPSITLLKFTPPPFSEEAAMDIALAFTEAGSGTPLILLHGNGEDGTYFAPPHRRAGPAFPGDRAGYERARQIAAGKRPVHHRPVRAGSAGFHGRARHRKGQPAGLFGRREHRAHLRACLSGQGGPADSQWRQPGTPRV